MRAFVCRYMNGWRKYGGLALRLLLVAGAALVGLVGSAPDDARLVLVQQQGYGVTRIMQIAAGLYYQCFAGFVVLFGVFMWLWPLIEAERKKPKK